MSEWQLWDLQSGNYLERFDTEAEGLAAIEAYVAIEGECYREWLGLRDMEAAP